MAKATTEGHFMSFMTQAREFIKGVRVESSKVSWPTRQELGDSTIVVIVTVILVSVFIGVVDRLLTELVKLLFKV